MRLIASILLLIACLVSLIVAGRAQEASDVSIENEFIRIRVNSGPQEAGRFAIDTTGGDPSRLADNNQILIYGSREPWTSYTSLLIDDKVFLFGGDTTRRAGKGTPTGTITQPPQVADGKIICTSRIGVIEITQELSFARNPATRVKDSVRINYRITNKGDTFHRVGLRLVLDTMLGANDGAPLRTGEVTIDKATRLVGGSIPDFWMAFDSLSQPTVIAQGTLKLPGIIPPDRMEMADWGTFADHPWGFPFPTGADFTRQGEQEQDTAVALYWESQNLAPGESRNFSTLYGVGGVSLSPAQLSLGLTAPAEVDYQYDAPPIFNVIAYIENSGGYQARNAVCVLELVPAFNLEQGELAARLGNLSPGETRQHTWSISPTEKKSGVQELTLSITSDNLESNKVVRKIVINSPPQLTMDVNAPKQLTVTPANRYAPNPFDIKATITNRGDQPAQNLAVSLSLTEGLKLEANVQAIQIAKQLNAGEKLNFSWPVRALGLPSGKLNYTLRASAAGAKSVKENGLISIPELTPELRVFPADQVVPLTTDGNPTLLPIAIKLSPTRNFFGASFSLSYNAEVLTPLYVSRGEAFVDEGRLLSPWSAGRMVEGKIQKLSGQRKDAPLLNAPESNLYTIVFMVRAVGESALILEEASLFDEQGNMQPHRLLNGKIKVEAISKPL